MKILVLVESPSKCKKIAGYLNAFDPANHYDVVATMGHINELKSLSDINMSTFECKYTLSDSKIKQINVIKSKIKESSEVIIATDDDREGESIGYHVCTTFGLNLLETKRIIFHEITESAIVAAIQNPSKINLDKVRAQQARQIMDLLVGFQLSPQLWANILKNNSLSAGRCQSTALRLIYDQEKEIEESVPTLSYNTTGYFFSQNLAFHLEHKFESKEDVENFLEESVNFDHVFQLGPVTKSIRKQPEPFTTSKLQQACSNEFHMSPKETMRICQSLYEAGLITYMRTDSKYYSEEFINTIKCYVTRNFEPRYLDQGVLDVVTLGKDIDSLKEEESVTTNKKKKAKVVKEPVISNGGAHEAIRPTDIFTLNVKDLEPKELKVYQLIWRNTLESCLPPAIFQCVKATITAFNSNVFVYTSEQIEFPGYKIVKPLASDTDPHFIFLQTLKKNAVVSFNKIVSEGTQKGHKLHFTEAHLVHLLEEKGIGRPSTFSSLVEKIQEKEYVKKQDVAGKKLMATDFELDSEGNLIESTKEKEIGKEKGKLVLTPLGKIVSEFLEKHFQRLINFDYTREMEDQLDKIAKRESDLQSLCSQCNTLISQCLEPLLATGNSTATSTMSQTRPESLGEYEGHPVYVKKGKFGLYAEWGTDTKSLKSFGNRPVESIRWEDVLPVLQSGSSTIRTINEHMTIRKGPKGFYIFYQLPKAKKPTFLSLAGFSSNFQTCELNELKTWIKDKFDILS